MQESIDEDNSLNMTNIGVISIFRGEEYVSSLDDITATADLNPLLRDAGSRSLSLSLCVPAVSSSLYSSSWLLSWSLMDSSSLLHLIKVDDREREIER